MPIEVTFRELAASLQSLNDALNALQVTLEDKPPHDEAAVADDMADKTLALLGLAHEARRTAARARHALKHPPVMDQAKRGLAACQRQFHEIEQSYAANLVSYEKLSALVRVGGRSTEWSGWASATKDGIERCRPPLEATSQALASCWQELVEHGGKTSISIRTQNLGQKIFAKGARDTVGSSST